MGSVRLFWYWHSIIHWYCHCIVVSEKHHNIFLRDEDRNHLFVLRPIWSNCPIFQEVSREFYFNSWITDFESQDKGYTHFQRFTFDLDCLGNKNIINCFKEVLNDTVMKAEEPTCSYYVSNSFGLASHYMPNTLNYLTSCFPFEFVLNNGGVWFTCEKSGGFSVAFKIIKVFEKQHPWGLFEHVVGQRDRPLYARSKCSNNGELVRVWRKLSVCECKVLFLQRYIFSEVHFYWWFGLVPTSPIIRKG